MKIKKIRITIVEPPAFMPVIRGVAIDGSRLRANRIKIENSKTLGRWFGTPPITLR